MTTMLTPAGPAVPGHPHVFAGNRSHVAVVLEYDQAVLAPAWAPLPYTAAALAASHPRTVLTLR